MRIVIQRVKRASVSVEEKVVGSIQKGFLTIALMREGKYDQILKRMENVLDLSKERRFCGKDGIWVGAE